MTPHEQVEAELTAYGVNLPGAEVGPGWQLTRALYVNSKMFAIFGAKAEPLDELTITVKLPISAEMVAGLYFVRESRGWYRRKGSASWSTFLREPGKPACARYAQA